LYTYANTSVYRKEDVAIPSSTGNSKYLNEELISVFPNPVSDILTIKFQILGDDFNWEIINIHGQEMKSGQANIIKGNSVKINVDNLPTGYYLLKTNIDGKISMSKFLKK